MSTYKFQCTQSDGAVVTVEYDDVKDPRLEAVVQVFVQFLYGVTYSPKSVAKFIKHEMVSG